MAIPRVTSESQDENVIEEAKRSAFHLRSISNNISASTQGSSKIDELIRLVGLPNNYCVDSNLTELYIDAIAEDFRVLSILFLSRLERQFYQYRNSLNFVKSHFGIYPVELDRIKLESSINQRFFSLNSFLSKDKSERNIEFWEEVDRLFVQCVEAYNAEMRSLWAEIEKLDKFRNDHGRYKLAKYSIILATVGLLLGQIKNIYENAIWIYEGVSKFINVLLP